MMNAKRSAVVGAVTSGLVLLSGCAFLAEDVCDSNRSMLSGEDSLPYGMTVDELMAPYTGTFAMVAEGEISDAVELEIIVERVGEEVAFIDSEPTPEVAACDDGLQTQVRLSMTSADGVFDEELDARQWANFSQDGELVHWFVDARVPASEWNGSFDFDGAQEADITLSFRDDGEVGGYLSAMRRQRDGSYRGLRVYTFRSAEDGELDEGIMDDGSVDNGR